MVFDAADLLWLVTGCALAFGSLLLLGGCACDLPGRRRVLVAGLGLFALASVATNLALRQIMMRSSRFVQGAAGVIIGGILTQYPEWRAIFLANVPIVGALLLLIPRVIPDDRNANGPRIDALGVVLVTAAAAMLICGLRNGQQGGLGAPGTVLALGAAVLLALAFVLVGRNVAGPRLPWPIAALIDLVQIPDTRRGGVK